jgi:hypothetical protein
MTRIRESSWMIRSASQSDSRGDRNGRGFDRDRRTHGRRPEAIAAGAPEFTRPARTGSAGRHGSAARP